MDNSPIVHVVVDVSALDPDKEYSAAERVTHAKYIENLNRNIVALRDQGIPTVFVSITDINAVHRNWDADTVRQLGLSELAMQPGDVIFEKRFMSGFPTQEDIRNSPALKDYIVSQRKDGGDYAKAFEKEPEASLTALLKNAKHMLISGGMAQFCVTDNSVDAARLGKDVTVLADGVIAWEKMGDWTKIVHNDPAKAEKEIRDTLDHIRENPAERGLKAEDIQALDRIEISTGEQVLKNIQALKAKYETIQQSGSKFAGNTAEPPSAKPETAPPQPAKRQKFSM